MAERVGFEPTVRFHAQQFSRLPDSTTLAPLRDLLPTLTEKRLQQPATFFGQNTWPNLHLMIQPVISQKPKE